MRSFNLRACSGRSELVAICIDTGCGLQVTITGGSSPHIGAAVMALPRKSLSGSGAISCDCFELPVPGHKDYIIARKTAVRICSELNVVTVACVGIHNDDISAGEIKAFVKLAEEITAEICRRLREEQRTLPGPAKDHKQE